jgi:hypothetical protein
MNTHTHTNRILVALALLTVGLVSARGDDVVWATGKVLDADGRRPVAGATVAVYDARNRVVDYVRTDQNGEYALIVPKSAINLPKKRGGLLHQVSKTVNTAVAGAGGLIGGPLKAGIRAAASAAGGADPITRAGVGAAAGLVNNIVDIVTGSGPSRRSLERNAPGVVTMRVASDAHAGVSGLNRVYWMQEEVYRIGGREQRALVAWLDPVHLSRGDGRERSKLSSELMCFTEAKLTPEITERGREVTVTVVFKRPQEPRAPVVVVARNSRTGRTHELKPSGDDGYECRLVVGRKDPLHDQIITVIAYADQDARPGRDLRVERTLERAGYWDPRRRFVYNPLLVAGRNRVELTLTVVEPPRAR